MDLDSHQYRFARLAVDKAKLCPPEDQKPNPSPRVAIVLARGSELLGWAAKKVGGEYLVDGEMRGFPEHRTAHAEESLLAQFRGQDLNGSTAYVTLEPCTKKNKGICCAELLVEAGVREIYVANIDPNPDVGGLAWRGFHKAEVKVLDFPSELRNEARRDNDAFFRKFQYSIAEEGQASFDYKNQNERVLGPDDRAFKTSWTTCNFDSIYALNYEYHVAVAKHCDSFDQVDDPARWFEDADYTRQVFIGQIVVFRNPFGYALVQILEVDLETEVTNSRVKFRYQIRYHKD